MKRIGGHRGYLLVDHRESPGVSETLIAQAQAAGYPVLNPGRGLHEADTYTCPHCQGIVVKSPRKTDHDRHVCLKCYGVTCGRPACVLSCRPMKALLDGDLLRRGFSL
jgi:hypothetical protein